MIANFLRLRVSFAILTGGPLVYWSDKHKKYFVVGINQGAARILKDINDTHLAYYECKNDGALYFTPVIRYKELNQKTFNHIPFNRKRPFFQLNRFMETIKRKVGVGNLCLTSN